MIIEMFGLPASGKTTVANWLVASMEATGVDAYLVSATRPARIGRLYRRITKLLNMIRLSLLATGAEIDARELLTLFPQQDRMRALRLQHYLVHLRTLLARANERDEVLIFDQGSLQALFSLASTSSSYSHESLLVALERLPQPDLLVALETPPTIVAERLRTDNSHGTLANIIASDEAAMFTSAQMSARLRLIAEARGWNTVVGEGDEHLVSEVVSRVVSLNGDRPTTVSKSDGGPVLDPPTRSPSTNIITEMFAISAKGTNKHMRRSA